MEKEIALADVESIPHGKIEVATQNRAYSSRTTCDYEALAGGSEAPPPQYSKELFVPRLKFSGQDSFSLQAGTVQTIEKGNQAMLYFLYPIGNREFEYSEVQIAGTDELIKKTGMSLEGSWSHNHIQWNHSENRPSGKQYFGVSLGPLSGWSKQDGSLNVSLEAQSAPKKPDIGE